MADSRAHTRAVLYLRISDSTDVSTALEGQNADLLVHAKREGWEVVRTLEDDGRSGAKRRANADECLRMLRDGEANLLAVYAVDRWSRQGLEAVGELCGVLRQTGARFYAIRESLSSDSDNFELQLGIHASIAKREWELIQGRVKSARERLIGDDRFPGGVVPFGYRTAPRPSGPGRVLEPDPAEVAIVLEVAERILDGATVTSIATDLNRRHVPTTRSEFRRATLAGKPTDDLDTGHWTTNIVQLLWTSDHLLGRVTRNGAAVVGADGLPREVWAPILDLSTLSRIRQRTRDPRARARAIADARAKAAKDGKPFVLARQEQTARRRARVLSGIAFCAHCGGKLYVHKLSGVEHYRCPRRARADCPAPGMAAHHLERAVADLVLGAFGDEPEVEVIEEASPSETAHQLAEAEAALAESFARIQRPGIDRLALLSTIETLEATIEDLRKAPSADIAVSYAPTGRTVREAWYADEDDGARRSLILSLVDHVTLSSLPDGTPRKGYHPERVGFAPRVDSDAVLLRDYAG